MSFDGWQTYSLGDLCLGIFDGPHATPKEADDGPVFLGISNLTNGRIDLSKTRHLSDEDFKKWTRRVTPQPKDLVFSYETRLGEAALIPEGLYCCLGRRMGLMRFKTEIVDPQFMLYAYLGPDFQQTIQRRTVYGSTVNRIPLIELPEFPISIPSLPTQRSIADILSVLDEKIELNRQTNVTLEATAQTLFKEWFVRFNFPGATGEMVESELGLIPRGWKINSLDEVAHYQNGLALQKFPPENEDFLPVIKIRELRQGRTDDNSNISSPNIKKSCIINNGDVVFSWSGSLLVDLWCGGKGALNQHLFKVTSQDHPKWFYYYWTKHHLEEFQRIAADKATTMGHIKRRHLSEAKVLVPPATLIETADILLAPILENYVLVNLESHNLTKLRDTLLPRLMSGEIEV
jgi:type I restriction enzyme, S subunit